MIWFYEHDGHVLRVETRYDNRASGYVLVVHRPEGATTERFAHADEFQRRLRVLEQALADEQWRQAGSPQFDPTGWPRRKPT